MGRHVVRGGLRGGFPSTSSSRDPHLELFFLIYFLMAVMAVVHGNQVTFQPPTHHQNKFNISQDEYESKYRLYFDTVEKNQRRRLRERGDLTTDAVIRKRLYRFSHSGIENTISISENQTVPLHYAVDIPKDDSTVIEQVNLRMLFVPKTCTSRDTTISISIKSNKMTTSKDFHLDGCLPRWDSIELPVTADPSLSLHCRNCRNTAISQPTLNVITIEQTKSRIRRNPTKNKKKGLLRRRFRGNCTRHPFIINFEEIPGYDFVWEPKYFDAGICGGKCTKLVNPASQHATLQGLLSDIDPSVPKPVCAPKTLEPLEILVKQNLENGETELILSVFEKAVIVDCACS